MIGQHHFDRSSGVPDDVYVFACNTFVTCTLKKLVCNIACIYKSFFGGIFKSFNLIVLY